MGGEEMTKEMAVEEMGMDSTPMDVMKPTEPLDHMQGGGKKRRVSKRKTSKSRIKA